MDNVNSSRATKTKVVRKTQPDTTTLRNENEIAQENIIKISERSKNLYSIAARLANHNFHYVNWYIPEGIKEFPQNDKLRYVDKMFPLAEGGKLLVDEPRFQWEMDRCEIKKKVFERLGYRYVVIKPNMTFEQAYAELYK